MKKDVKEMAENAKQWVKSPQGQDSLKKALNRANQATSHLKEARRVDPSSLKRSFTV